MITGMTKAKIAVTIDEELLAEARQRVGRGDAASLSAYIEDAVRTRVESGSLRELLDEMLEESGGPMTDEERAEFDRIYR
jgi:Arc/MetJ family transcription regulator